MAIKETSPSGVKGRFFSFSFLAYFLNRLKSL